MIIPNFNFAICRGGLQNWISNAILTNMQITVEPRNIFGKKLGESRKEGKLPVVVYGKKSENKSFFAEAKDFLKIWKEVGESTVIQLNEGGKTLDVLIHDVAICPIKNIPIHADFLAVDMDKLIITTVPLVFDGVALAVKQLGGVLVKVAHEVEVEALPKNLPHELRIDISKLQTFDDKINVEEIVLPDGVKMITNFDEVVALVEAPNENEEETSGPTSLEDIEVKKKGKKPTEDEAKEGDK